jgi:hypothetical protein
MSSKHIVALAFFGAAVLFGPADPVAAQISLGTAQNFGVLGGSTVTNTGATTVNGDVGVSPGTAVTGFPPGLVVGGSIHNNDAVAVQAQSDLTIAYNAIVSTPCTVDLTGQNLGGLTLTPGVYCFSSSAQLTGALTLDALGNPDALFLFKIGSTLTTSSGASVTVTNGGTSCNQVYWQVGSSATIGTGSSFAGDILALTSITLTTGADTTGRVLARNGAVTLDTNDVNTCGPGVACAVITVDPPTLPNGTVGVAYNQIVSATGGASPYTFAVSSGALPTGLTLDPNTGAIAGTPTAVGSFDFTITATDANGCPGTRLYTVVIAAPGCPVITLSPITLPPGRVGLSYSQAITPAGGTGPYTFVVASGTLPSGLTLGSTTGVISGVPLSPGLSSFTIQATDSGGCSGARPYTVTILAATVPSAIPTADPLTLILMAVALGTLGVFVARRFTS